MFTTHSCFFFLVFFYGFWEQFGSVASRALISCLFIHKTDCCEVSESPWWHAFFCVCVSSWYLPLRNVALVSLSVFTVILSFGGTVLLAVVDLGPAAHRHCRVPTYVAEQRSISFRPPLVISDTRELELCPRKLAAMQLKCARELLRRLHLWRGSSLAVNVRRLFEENDFSFTR